MVTIDNVVESVGKFDSKRSGDIKYLQERRRDYIGSLQALELVETQLAAMDGAIKSMTGFDVLTPPEETVSNTFSFGQVSVEVTSIPVIKKPAYKSAVDDMERHLKGYGFMLAHGRAITGIAKAENARKGYVIAAPKLLDEFETIISGIMLPGIRQPLEVTVSEEITAPRELDMNYVNDDPSSPDFGVNYQALLTLKEDLSTFVRAYERTLKKQKKTSGIVQVTSRNGFEEKKRHAQIGDWKAVAGTFVTLPSGEREGELNIIVGKEYAKSTLQKKFPHYYFEERQPFSNSTNYLGLTSVLNRLEDLKAGQTNTSRTKKYTPIEIV